MEGTASVYGMLTKGASGVARLWQPFGPAKHG
jgi:hypothetical protein